MTVTRQGFSGIVSNAFASIGLSPEAPWIVEFPADMFWPNSDLSPVSENIDKVVYALTKWQAQNDSIGVQSPPNITVEGQSYDEAVAKMNDLFLKNMWSDGMPLTPATAETVDWILTGTDLPRDQVIGTIGPRGGIATVEQTAVALAMAGGRPEYLPVLIAIVETIVDPVTKHAGWQASTGSQTPAVIVNGPIGEQIRINSGYGLLGPDPNHPAGASIGRALRLILQDLGGAVPGTGTMSIMGSLGRYTGTIIAEDEAGIPEGWDPLNVELGFPKGSNTVTLFIVIGFMHVPDTETTTERNTQACLDKYADYMQAFQGTYGIESVPDIILMGREVPKGLADFGYTKQEVQSYLWEASKVPWSQIVKLSKDDDLADMQAAGYGKTDDELVPIAADPSYIKLVVAGGAEGGHGIIMQGGKTPVTKEIQLPANWDALLKQAEQDLGPLPAPMQ
jgi:hypothetical protein